MPLLNISPLQRHLNAWKNCTKCPLCNFRKNVVLAKGKVPADILFIGEAPGDSEDVLGTPFAGPAGQLLDDMIKLVQEKTGTDFRKAFTNVVACIPKDDATTKRKEGTPNAKEIKACAPRVEDFIQLCKPRMIVCVGKIATKRADVQKWSERVENLISIIHPSAILQADVSVQGLHHQRALIQLADAFTEL